MTEKLPYVRYSVTAEVRNKGVGFTIKNAITAFLSHHNLEGTMTNINTASNSFSAVLNIYDNGNPDILMTALLEHIRGSGNLPHLEKFRPNVTIKPIVPEEYFKIDKSRPVANDASWVDSITSLQDRHAQESAGLNRRIEDLNAALAERQKVISAKTEEARILGDKVKSLEHRLQQSQTAQFQNPLSAVLAGYLKQGIEAVFETFVDYTTLFNNNDLELFLTNSNVPSFVAYINAKCTLSLKSDDELQEKILLLQSADSWDKTPKGQELARQSAQAKADCRILETAMKENASETVINAIRAVINDKKTSGVQEQIGAYIELFSKERVLVQQWEMLHKNYVAFQGIYSAAAMRRQRECVLPVVIYTPNVSELRIYVPAFDIQNPLHEHLRTILSSLGIGERYSFSYSQCQEDIVELKATTPMDLKSSRVIAEQLGQVVKNDSLLNALGIEPKLIYLAE